MTSTPSRLDRLLGELAGDRVVPERYSRKTMLFRSQSLFATTAMAAIAILAGMVLGGGPDPRSAQVVRGRRRLPRR